MATLKKIVKKFDIVGFYTGFDYKMSENFVFNGESHDFWEIVLVLDGEVDVTEDEKVYRLKKNSMILHAPMEFHRIKSAGGTSPYGYIISFLTEGELPENLKNGIFILNSEQIREYTAICKDIKTFLSGKEESEYFSQSTAQRLCEFLLKLAANDNVSCFLMETSGASEYRKAVSVMTEKVCENITLSELGEYCHISVSYIKVLFQKHAGISPMKYYSNLRLQHIITLMKSGMSNKAIASVMNFSSINYFSIFFKSMVGMTATEYRKNLNL